MASVTQEDFDKFVEEQDVFLKPKLRMFLSIDLVNSTAFKQKVVADASNGTRGRARYSPWLGEIARFYYQFPLDLAQSWQKVSSYFSTSKHGKDLEAPRLWKANGDELIYVAELAHAKHAKICFYAWLDAIRNFRTSLFEKSHGLDIKSVCWLAGFPIRNTEILFRAVDQPDRRLQNDGFLHQFKLNNDFYVNGKKEGIIQDYVGPSIDTGFRLGSHATPRKLMLSVDAAYLIAKSKLPSVSTDEITGRAIKELKELEVFGYDGRSGLKGVMGGVPYPLFWIDCESNNPTFAEINQREEGLFGNKHKINAQQVEDYCDSFFDRYKNRVSPPFIHSDQDFDLPAGDDYYDDYIEEVSRWKKLLEAERDHATLSQQGSTSQGSEGDEGKPEEAVAKVLTELKIAPQKQLAGKKSKKKSKTGTKKILRK